jgi:hypothetical protein
MGVPPPVGAPQRKALLVGCSYRGSAAALKGCINDVKCMVRFEEVLRRTCTFNGLTQTNLPLPTQRHLLITRFHFPDNMIVTLDDEQMHPDFLPTRFNIVRAIGWLLSGQQPGSSLFFHFSGHGGQVTDYS